MSIDFEQDVAQEEPLSKDKLERVMQLAQRMVDQEFEVKALEDELKNAKALLFKTQTEDLPLLMEELGMLSVTLKDGSKVDVVEDIQCGIAVAARDEAHNWLIQNGFGGLIKTQVITEFGRGQIEDAVKYAQEANERFPENPAGVKDAVHPATLKSFLKEQLEKGAALPMELFGVRPFNRAKYTKAR